MVIGTKIEELRPMGAAVVIEWLCILEKLKIKTCQSTYVAWVQKEEGAQKLFWQKVEDYTRVRSGGAPFGSRRQQ